MRGEADGRTEGRESLPCAEPRKALSHLTPPHLTPLRLVAAFLSRAGHGDGRLAHAPAGGRLPRGGPPHHGGGRVERQEPLGGDGAHRLEQGGAGGAAGRERQGSGEEVRAWLLAHCQCAGRIAEGEGLKGQGWRAGYLRLGYIVELLQLLQLQPGDLIARMALRLAKSRARVEDPVRGVL